MAKKKKEKEETQEKNKKANEEVVEEETVVEDEEELVDEKIDEKLEENEDIDDEDDTEEELDEDEEIDDESEEDEEPDDDDIEENPIKKTMSDKTRYIIISIVTVVLLALIVVLIIFGDNSSNDSKSSSSNSNVEERNTSTDTLKEFYKEFDSEDLNVIFFASATCGYCTLEKPIIENISKDYDMDYYAIDASTLSQDELNEIIKALGIRGATPTTVIVKKGEVVATNEGYLDGKPYVDFFVENGILKEGSTYKEEVNLVSINYKKFKEIAKKDKESLVFLDSSACQACITARSILNELAEKNDFEVNYLSAASLDQSDINELVDNDLKDMGYDEETYVSDSQIKIPLLLVVKDNKIKDYVLESTDESEYTKILKKYDFIK